MLDAAYASDSATLRLGQGKLAQDKVAQAGLAGAGETRDRAAAREAAENFEAVFVSQMVSHMFAGIQEDSLFGGGQAGDLFGRSEEHTSELQSLMRISYAVFCLKKKMIHNIK